MVKTKRAQDKDPYFLLLQPQTPVLGRNQHLVCGTQDEETPMTPSPGMGLEGKTGQHGISR